MEEDKIEYTDGQPFKVRHEYKELTVESLEKILKEIYYTEDKRDRIGAVDPRSMFIWSLDENGVPYSKGYEMFCDIMKEEASKLKVDENNNKLKG